MTTNLNQQQTRERNLHEYQAERKARNPDRTPSRTFCNANQPPNSYVPPNWTPARADADQHFQYTGAGFQAQIRRV